MTEGKPYLNINAIVLIRMCMLDWALRTLRPGTFHKKVPISLSQGEQRIPDGEYDEGHDSSINWLRGLKGSCCAFIHNGAAFCRHTVNQVENNVCAEPMLFCLKIDV
jgi:hypothetical protein